MTKAVLDKRVGSAAEQKFRDLAVVAEGGHMERSHAEDIFRSDIGPMLDQSREHLRVIAAKSRRVQRGVTVHVSDIRVSLVVQQEPNHVTVPSNRGPVEGSVFLIGLG